MKIYENLIDLIGNTPLVKINKMNKGVANVVAKIEYFNPAGSIKDRAALSMIQEAENKNLIKSGETVIIEPTSGNTGIGLALVCLIKGYRLILTMPDSMSEERRNILKAYGAELVLTEGTKGMQGAVDEANRLHHEIKNSFIPQQFSNPANSKIHYDVTAEEIWNDTDGKVDIIVAGVGTGGTISGIARKLKEKKSLVKVYAVEPLSSPLISQGYACSHKIQGIGANFVPENYDASVVDEVISVADDAAIQCACDMAKTEGIFAGISSGAALWAALELSKRQENKDKLIVVILPDTGMRYLSSSMFKK
ncbi:cysteine synthase A [bacterium]|nr:cysteine synthase A [bacterium]